jgi:subtilisin family serine protease
MLAEALDFVGQPVAASEGWVGDGAAVAVLDMGADYGVADLGACAAPGDPGCRVVYAQDFAPDDGLRDDPLGHGTNVASIVAAVAPGAQILALDVFDGDVAAASDVLAAFDWVLANKDAYGIVAIEAAFGSPPMDQGDCYALDPLREGALAAYADDVLVVAPTGDDGDPSRVSSPACHDYVLPVGAVYDAAGGTRVWSTCTDASPAADQAACFSNIGTYAPLLAPGVDLTAGGVTMSGTSQASALVAGAVAVLRGRDPSASATDIAYHLEDNAAHQLVGGYVTSRLDLAAANEECVYDVAPSGAQAPWHVTPVDYAPSSAGGGAARLLPGAW